MAKIVIMTDSTSDLPPQLIKDLDVKVLSMYINFDKQVYRDGIDITTRDLYQKVEEHGFLPKTSCLTPVDFYQAFKEYIEQGYDVVYIGISMKFSATCQNGFLMKKEFPEGRIFVVDGQNLSTGTGLLVIKACKFRDQGLSAAEISTKVQELIPFVRTQFLVDNLEYLHKGGRCSGTVRVFGTMLAIKPNIKVKDGGMIVARKPHGKKQGLLLMLQDFFDDYPNIDQDCIFITHTEAMREHDFMRQQIANKGFTTDNIATSEAGCVISSHCGPGSIGILYILKPNAIKQEV